MAADRIVPDYRLIDMDNHYYESADCFSRHIEAKYKDRVIELIPGGVDEQGQARQHLTRWAVAREPLPWLSKNLGERTRPPGTILGVFEGKISRNDLDVAESFNPQESLPAAFDREQRIKTMDAQHVESCLMLPSHALTFEEDLADRPDVWLANLRSFNRWLEEAWGFGADGRIFTAPMISLIDVNEAVAELERVVEAGARAFYFKMGTSAGRSPADEHFDPFWARVNEIGISPVLHIDNSGYEKIMAEGWGYGRTSDSGYYSRQTAALKFLCEVQRTVADTVGMLVLQNLFGRFPNIRMMVVETGSDWIVPLMNQMDKAAKGAMQGAWSSDHGRINGKLPSEVMRDHFWIAPFPEDDIPALVKTIGVENVLFGSDWPHSEGEAEPLDYLARLDGLSPTDVRKIMRDNGAKALGITF